MTVSLCSSNLIFWLHKNQERLEFYHLQDLSKLYRPGFYILCPLLKEFFCGYFKGERLFRFFRHYE